MSQNDVILVIRSCIRSTKRWFVVSRACNADTEWTTEFALAFVIDESNKFTYDRGKALCRAHDLQSRLNTEYGVWEMYV
tara:strand:+ start:669 stop:905 length:237 start_codon:yes stop_codon:yes gene_type:complete